MARSAWCVCTMALALAACEEPELEPAMPMPADSPFHYPLALWDQGIEGSTLLLVHITREGTVDSAIVRQSSGYEAFDSAALAGARELNFRPARRGKNRVDSWLKVPVQFRQRPHPDAPPS